MKTKEIKIRKFAESGTIIISVCMFTLILALSVGLENQAIAQSRYEGHTGNYGHYSGTYARGNYVSHPVNGCSRVYYGGRDYYYHGGTYYHSFNGGYVAVAPPVGIGIDLLPEGYTSLYVGGIPYYCFGGTYYVHRGGHYVVVDAPGRAVVRNYHYGYHRV